MTRVILGLPEWNLNGVCIFAANLARGLRARGVDARLFITEEQTPLVQYPRIGAAAPDDLVIDRVRLGAHDEWSDAWIEIERYLEEQGPCVYIPNHDFRASCVTPRLSSRVSVVGMLHADNGVEYEHVSHLARHWDAVVAVNPAIRHRAALEMPWLAARLATIPIGVALPGARAQRPPSTTLRLIYHGELRAHQKRVLDLVALLDGLMAAGVQARLTLVGDGPARGAIEARGAHLIASGALVLRGALPHAETLRELERHDVYVLASEFEGTPNALLEAMARGCVPVVSDLATLASVVMDGETGLLITPGDLGAFTEAVASLAHDPQRRAAMAARAKAAVREGPYNLERMVDGWLALLARVEDGRALSARRPRRRMNPPPATLAGVSILPGSFQTSARQANRVPLWPDPQPVRRTGRTLGPHLAPLKEHRIVVAATSGRISGVDVFAVHLVRALAAQGYRAEILVTQPDEQVADPLPFPDDVPLRTLCVTPRTPWQRRWAALRDDLCSGTAPAIYVPNYDWRHSGISPTLPARVKIVGIAHSDDPQHYEHVLRLGDAWNGIVAVSEAIAGELAALAPQLTARVATIPYGVPVAARLNRGPRPAGAPLRIAYVGRLSRYQKRVLHLVEIADQLDGQGVKFELIVAGGGCEQAEFLRAASPHLLKGTMRFVGALSNERVQTLLDRVDAFVLPSRFEGLPVALLEAMARGVVPVVADIRSGVRQVVRDGTNGFLVPTGDGQAFADRLARLARSAELNAAMGAAAHRSIASGPYRIEAMVDAYLALFELVAREPFLRPRSGARHPEELAGPRSLLPPALPTPLQVSLRLRQIANRICRLG